jgi:phage FluMu protein Com
MGYMSEYIKQRLDATALESELVKLISQYNKLMETFAVVYVSAIGKPIPDVALSADDYYLIHDLIRDIDSTSVTLYLETPGGRAETAEEIVKCLRNRFEHVSFVVSGEAKSAGTIMVLSADEILMTETGSLGPIDAQVKIGRSVVSAYDYVEWVDGKREEAEGTGKLNPFDATVIAQISPGEISGVYHALKYAEDLVVDWLVRYKFKHWATTQTRKLTVTPEMKQSRAQAITTELLDHSRWRTHGRSIKIGDLEDIGLKVVKVEDNPKLSELVYKIQTVCRLLFTSTTTYKIFATEREKVFKKATPVPKGTPIPAKSATAADLDVNCPKCGELHKIYVKLVDDPKIDVALQKKGRIAYPRDNNIKCSCGFVIDLTGLRNEMESKIGKKIVI